MSIFGNCSHRQKLCMHTTYYSVDTGVHGVLLQTVLDNCSGFNCKSNAVCSLSAVWVKPCILCSGQAGSDQGGGIHWAPEAADSSNSLYFTSVHARCDWALAGGSAEQKGKLWTLSRWSLKLLLQVSEGSSYHTAWCYPVGAFSGTLCVADSSLAVLQAESHICLRAKLVLKRRAGCCLGFCVSRAIQVNLRCRREGSCEVPNTGNKQGTCLSSPGSWAVPSRFHFMPQLFLYIPIDRQYWSLSAIGHCVNIWDFLLIQSSCCLFLSHFLKCNLSINDSHAFD